MITNLPLESTVSVLYPIADDLPRSNPGSAIRLTGGTVSLRHRLPDLPFGLEPIALGIARHATSSKVKLVGALPNVRFKRFGRLRIRFAVFHCATTRSQSMLLAKGHERNSLDHEKSGVNAPP